jgi:parallel beta-helix repeat protein
VKPPAVSSVTISPSTLATTVGQQTQLAALVRDASGNVLLNRSVTWSTSNAATASISAGGLLTAVAAGSVKITAVSENKRGSLTVTVGPVGSPVVPDTTSAPEVPLAASVSVTLNASTLTVGQTAQANATVLDAQSNVLTGRSVSWTSSDATVASVNANGQVAGLKAGSAVITGSVDGKSGDAVVVVSAPVPVPRTLALTINRTRLALGELAQGAAVVRDANGAVIPDATVSWASTPSAVATVSTSGVVLARSVGTAAISASIAGLSQSLALTVIDSAASTIQPAASVTVSPTGVRLAPGQTTKLAAKALDAGGAPIANAPISWTTSNASVATVDSGGTVRGVAPGSAMITALDGNQSAAASVAVTDLSVASLSVTLGARSLNVGQTTQATATPYDANGQPLSGRTVIWTSGSSAVATISTTGLVTAKSAGTSILTATVDGVSGGAAVSVANEPDVVPVAGVPVNPGESIQSKVDANPSGTTFVIKAGTHVRQSVVPKSGDAFIGEPDAILDGDGSVICAFCPGSTKPANVRIAHLEIRNYGPASPTYNNVYGDGAIKGGGDEISDGTRGWVVDSNYIHDNRNMGIRIGVKMLVRGNRIVHNAGPHGLGGIGDSAVIVGNEIATNNYLDRFDPGFSAGGFKFVLSTGVVIKSNWIHHNHGMGAWGDIANRNMTFDGNTVEDNTTVGIMYEISYGCKVTNNIARRNGLGDPNNWLYPAGILIAHSPDCEVANNTLDGNVHGIIGIQQNRTDDMVYGPHTLKNLWVHDNTVTHSGSGFAAGVGADYGDPFGAAANNKFDRNQYTTAATAPFAWAGGGQSWSAWRGYGEDAAGTLTSR